MTPSPIHKVLSVMLSKGVQHLLMGGQACIVYGAAEFSRDADLAVLAVQDNLERLRDATDELNAAVVAVPPFEREFLERGHAVHFRCGRADVSGVRIDVMARMRGVAPFDVLWSRRTTVQLPGADGTVLTAELLSLPDLVASKKTQRDKHWPMVRRLVEANYFGFRHEPTDERVQFWLRELRTPELLVECTASHVSTARPMSGSRSAVGAALDADVEAVNAALADEEARERAADRDYWRPLRAELEQLRRARS